MNDVSKALVTRRKATLILASTAALAPIARVSFAAENSPLDFTILATSDLHGHVAAYDYYRDVPDPAVGLARVATLIARARSASKNLLLVDNGDLIQGNPLADLAAADSGPHAVIEILNQLGYDAGTVGNHEFNYGLPILDRAVRNARFPLTVANLARPDGSPLLPRRLLLDRTLTDRSGQARKVKIGVLGLCPPQILAWDKSNLDGKLLAEDMVETATREAARLKRDGADLVVALAHTGIDARPHVRGAENVGWHLAHLSDIDAIVTGHAHRVFPGPGFAGLPEADLAAGTIAGKPVVMPGFYGSHLGVLQLVLQADDSGRLRVTSGRAEARPIASADVTADPAVEAAIAPMHARTLAYVRRPVGRTTAPIHSFFAMVRDDPSVAMVQAVQLSAARARLAGTDAQALPLLSAAAPFRAGSGSPDAYVDIAAGPLAIKNVADLYLYPNTLTVVAVDGRGLRAWLEMAAGAFATLTAGEVQPLLAAQFASFNFDAIAGIDYTIDVTKPARYDRDGALIQPDSQRISALTYEGRPVRDDDRFAVVTNNYRAGGGGHFPGLDGSNILLAAPDPMQTLIAAWLTERGTIDPAALHPPGRWRLARSDVRASFRSSPRGATVIDDPRIRFEGPAADGYANFTLDLGAA
ncbi:bifunctional 2',3'-cyclic-nucleotide 2'-phosphodiesterase/3'-nucleotidase [Roseiterribacter gracilis]